MRATAAALLAATAAAGCFVKPDKPGATSDATGSDASSNDGAGSGTTPIARKIKDAHWCGSGTTGMSQAQYAIPTAGIASGDLVLFLANMDNGDMTNTVFTLPDGFTQIFQTYFYGGDGQSYVAGYKIVDNVSAEPLTYTKPYGAGLMSGCAVVVLIGVTNFDRANPIDSKVESHEAAGEDPVTMRSHITTTRPNTRLIFAGGADWLTGGGTFHASFVAPPTFDTLDTVSDEGSGAFTWATELVATRVAAAAGDSGVQDGETDGTIPGTPWTVELAISPGP
jgi:hypothetical protein